MADQVVGQEELEPVKEVELPDKGMVAVARANITVAVAVVKAVAVAVLPHLLGVMVEPDMMLQPFLEQVME